MNIKAYILKNGFAIIGKFNKELNSLEDILQLKRIEFYDQKTGASIPSLVAVPLGYPINQKEQTLTLDKLDILFEITDTMNTFINVYERDLDVIQNPGIIQPQSKIIH